MQFWLTLPLMDLSEATPARTSSFVAPALRDSLLWRIQEGLQWVCQPLKTPLFISSRSWNFLSLWAYLWSKFCSLLPDFALKKMTSPKQCNINEAPEPRRVLLIGRDTNSLDGWRTGLGPCLLLRSFGAPEERRVYWVWDASFQTSQPINPTAINIFIYVASSFIMPVPSF